MVQSAVATMAALSMDMKMELIHTPLVSGNYTGDREAKLVINSNHLTGTGDGSPRLYYSINEGPFMELQAYNSVLDTFFFMIPGQEMGTQVDYYLAAQNEDATMVATIPDGGRGINPPGTIAPEDFFTYLIANINSMTLCSNTLPKPIQDLQNLYDTIYVELDEVLMAVNVNLDITHSYDGDVQIYLISPDEDYLIVPVYNQTYIKPPLLIHLNAA